jgi:hypothetical protein
MFVEHAEAGIVWGRIFNADKNAKLISAFLQSPWFSETFPFSQALPAGSEVPSVELIPDTCWHQVAAAAGLRTLLKLQVAVGKNVQWTSWLHQLSLRKQTYPKPQEVVLDHTLQASKNGRAVCAECLHWRATEICDRCEHCRRFVCQACSAIQCHLCPDSVQLRDTQEVITDSSLPQESMGSLIGAAAECTAIGSALRARIPKHCRNVRSSLSPVAGGALWSGLVEQCTCEQVPLMPSRLLDCGSEVLAASYSHALLAVRTRQQVRLIRRGDWKTLLSVPSATPCFDPGLELLEDRSLLITTVSNGLNVLQLETLESTLVNTERNDWLLKVVDKGLLTASTSAACLRDLERPKLPLISTWCCHPLCFGRAGAIVVAPPSKNQQRSQTLQWLDPRQSELVSQNLLSKWECFEKANQTECVWTAAAIAPRGDDDHVVVLGSSSGQLVATDLRHCRLPLWSINRVGYGTVRRIYASERLLFAETYMAPQASPQDIHLDGRLNKMTQAVSWHGRSLAVFTGMHVVASRSGACLESKSESLLACGIGNSVLVVGAPPSVVKERISRSDDAPRNGHKSRVWERGTRHSNNRRT